MDAVFWVGVLLTLIAVVAKLSGFLVTVSWWLIILFPPALFLSLVVAGVCLAVITAVFS